MVRQHYKCNRYLIFVFYFLITLVAKGQTTDYEKISIMPLFKIWQVKDSTAFQKFNLPKKHNTVFVLFSPDCDHCKVETQKIIANIKKFKKTQFVFVAWASFNEIKQFYYDNKLNEYGNFVCGKDNAFLLPPFFKVKTTPTVVLYNKKQNYLQRWEGNINIQELIDLL